MTFEQKMIRSLVKYDKDQLIELFHDMVDLDGGMAAVQQLTEVSYEFLENYVPRETEGEHEYVDWKRIDDAQRM